MMDYNSQRKKLLLPEYGRHIQKMVNYALTIEDKEERTRCSRAIIGNMGNMFPHLRDVSDFKHKLWDHLAIMSDFKLDIDAPYDLPEPETLYRKPEKLPYNNERIKFRHYGRTIEMMIDKAVEMEEGDLKEHLILLIATHMKKSLLTWNKDFPGDERVFNDIKKMSGDKLIPREGLKIPEVKEGFHRPNPARKKQYKKK